MKNQWPLIFAILIFCPLIAFVACCSSCVWMAKNPVNAPRSTYATKTETDTDSAIDSRIPVGSAVVIRCGGGQRAFVADSLPTLERLVTFAKANDDAGAAEIIAAGRAALVLDGTLAKVISYPHEHVTEIRILTGPASDHLWVIPSEHLVVE